MTNLLSIGIDPKTSKGEKSGVITGISYMAPAKSSGFNVCSSASPGCIKACLNLAGRGVFESVQTARLTRTHLFFDDRSAYFEKLISEIKRLIRKAERADMTPTVRLNGTSDLPWERIPVVINGQRLSDNIMSLFPDVQFYDYTKHQTRWNLPANYDLTFSHSEKGFAPTIRNLRAGRRVAVVFDSKKGQPLPTSWRGYPVSDGDVNDLRYQDKQGIVVGLRAKGPAKIDESGFVVRI